MSEKLKRFAACLAMLALIAVLMLGLSYTVPADLALLAAIDMATYIDALVGVYLVARVARMRPALVYVRLHLSRAVVRLRPRRLRARKQRKTMTKAAFNDDHPGLAVPMLRVA